MCVILVGEINSSLHKQAAEQNRDGFSLFNEQFGLVKAPTKAQVEASFGKFGIWHYRIGTSGRMSVYNVHPFPVCKGKYLLYHNGVLGSGVGQKSDTHAFADSMKDLSLATVRSILRATCKGQRFLLVDAKNPRKFELFGEWEVEGGVIMSHKMYKPVYKTAAPWRGHFDEE